MSNESRIRDRIRFQEVAKLADTTGRRAEPGKAAPGAARAEGGAIDATDATDATAETEEKDDSGLIDLAAIAAGEAKSRPSSAPGSSSGVQTKQSLLSWSVSAAMLVPGPAPGNATQVPPDTTRPTTLAAERNAERDQAARDPSERGPHASGSSSGASTGSSSGSSSGSSTMWVALVGGIAVGAVSAIVAFKLHDGHGARSGDVPGSDHALISAVAPPAPGAPASSSGGWTVTTAPLGSPAAGGVDLSTVPGSQPSTAPSAVVRAAPEPGSPAPPAGVATAVPPARVAGPAHATPAAETPANPDSLEAMMKRAVHTESPQTPGAPAPTPAPAAPQAAAPPTNVPLKPAMGAVMGALGAVLPGARYCLGPDDPVSRATITFLSDGSVESVAIAGDAAGQPAESCIRARLMDARVPPFANPRFTWTVPVRPAN